GSLVECGSGRRFCASGRFAGILSVPAVGRHGACGVLVRCPRSIPSTRTRNSQQRLRARSLSTPAHPPPNADSPPPVPARRAGGVLRSVLAWTLRICVIAWFVAAGTVLVVRHVLMPAVDGLRAPIAAMLAQQLALPVSIERIEGGWAGWRPRLRIEGLRV